MAAVSRDLRQCASVYLVMMLAIIGPVAMEDKTTFIPDRIQEDTALEDTTLPFQDTRPEQLQNDSSEAVPPDNQDKLSADLNSKATDIHKESRYVKPVENTSSSELDIQPTEAVSKPSVDVSKESTGLGTISNDSAGHIQPSIALSPSSAVPSSFQPTPTSGIDLSHSLGVSSVVNSRPLSSPLSTLHSSVLSTSSKEFHFNSSSVASVPSTLSEELFSSLRTQLSLSDAFSAPSSVVALSAASAISTAATNNNASAVMASDVAADVAASVVNSSSVMMSLSYATNTLTANASLQQAGTNESLKIANATGDFPLEPSSSIQASASSFPAPETASVHYSTWLVNATASHAPDRLSTELIAPSPTATTHQMPRSSIIETTRVPHVRTWQDSVYQFVFEGNCTLLMESPSLLKSFLGSVQHNLAKELAIPAERVYTGNVRCGSVIVNVTVEHTDMTRIDDQIMEIIASGNFSFAVNDSEHELALMYQAAGVKVLLSPSIGLVRPSAQVPVQTEPFEDSLLRGFWELSETERILIIVFSVLGGFLFILAVAYIVHICCLRGQSKSFDLGDTPDHQVKLEDFTLTKLQRPPTIYDEHGVILTEDLHPGQTKMAVPYMPPGGHTCCHGHNTSTFKDSPGMLRRANNSAMHGSAENLVTHHELAGALRKDTGIDNMSFSSDDILGDRDGDEATDVDSDDDDEMSPRHHRSRPKLLGGDKSQI